MQIHTEIQAKNEKTSTEKQVEGLNHPGNPGAVRRTGEVLGAASPVTGGEVTRD